MCDFVQEPAVTLSISTLYISPPGSVPLDRRGHCSALIHIQIIVSDLKTSGCSFTYVTVGFLVELLEKGIFWQ